MGCLRRPSGEGPVVRIAPRVLTALLLLGLLGSACASTAPADPDYVAGRTAFRTCAACHGDQGQGGAGPAFDQLLSTFPDCEDHVEWISLGSAAWKEVVGETYGATDKPLVGGMPAFGDSLTETELRQVAFYERVRFAERDPDTERDACGL